MATHGFEASEEALAGTEKAPGRGGLFTRRATGLVREIGTLDAFLLNIFWINLFVGILIYTQAPAIFPGVNMWLGFLISTLVLIAPALVYAFLAAAMPRAGGDYVYVSRIIHPALGFLCSFAFSIMMTLFICIFAALMTLQCVSSFLTTVGTVADSPTMVRWGTDVTSDNWTFGIGAGVILAITALNYVGLRPLMLVVRGMFVVAIVGIVISAVLLASTSHAEFARDFSEYGSVTGVVVDAQREGVYDATIGNNAGTMLAFLALGFTVLAFLQFPAYAAGELRRPRRSTLVAILGALLFAGGLFSILGALASRTFGDDFLGAMTSLFNAGSESYPPLPPPFYFLYAGLTTDSITLNVIMSLGIILGFLGAIAMLMLVVSRNLLAYSLDGLMPTWIRGTHPRFHSPRNAILVIGAAALAVYIPYVYAPSHYFNFLFSGVALLATVFTVTMMAAVVLPWLNRPLFESSPFNQRIGGVPLITILGLASAALYSWWCYKMFTDDRIGANLDEGVIAIGAIYGFAAVWYVGAWLYNRRRGVDLALRYTELPPE
jgi:APA family basic amino acid/polyamine antiporter